MADPEYIVEMKHITKRFPGIVANDDVSITLSGSEYADIMPVAQQVLDKVRQSPMFVRPRIDYDPTNPRVIARLDRERAAMAGEQVAHHRTQEMSVREQPRKIGAHREAELLFAYCRVKLGGLLRDNPAGVHDLEWRGRRVLTVPGQIEQCVDESFGLLAGLKCLPAGLQQKRVIIRPAKGYFQRRVNLCERGAQLVCHVARIAAFPFERFIESFQKLVDLLGHGRQLTGQIGRAHAGRETGRLQGSDACRESLHRAQAAAQCDSKRAGPACCDEQTSEEKGGLDRSQCAIQRFPFSHNNDRNGVWRSPGYCLLIVIEGGLRRKTHRTRPSAVGQSKVEASAIPRAVMPFERKVPGGIGQGLRNDAALGVANLKEFRRTRLMSPARLRHDRFHLASPVRVTVHQCGQRSCPCFQGEVEALEHVAPDEAVAEVAARATGGNKDHHGRHDDASLQRPAPPHGSSPSRSGRSAVRIYPSPRRV